MGCNDTWHGTGDVVAVLGPGIRGLCAAAAAKDAGAEFVMMTGLGARDADRLGLASRFGADLVVDVAVDDPVAALRERHRKAGRCRRRRHRQGAGRVRSGRRTRPPGRHRRRRRNPRVGHRRTGFHARHGGTKELRIVGALGVDATAYRAALDVLASGRYPFADLPRRCVGLDGAEDLLATMAGEGDDAAPVHGVVTP